MEYRDTTLIGHVAPLSLPCRWNTSMKTARLMAATFPIPHCSRPMKNLRGDILSQGIAFQSASWVKTNLAKCKGPTRLPMPELERRREAKIGVVGSWPHDPHSVPTIQVPHK